MILIYAFLLGLTSKYLLINNKKKYSVIILSLLLVISFFFISVDIITEKGFSRAFWYHLNHDILSGSYIPYLNLFLVNITFFLIIFFIAYYFGKKGFFLKKIKKYFSYKILVLFLIILNPAIVSIFDNLKLDQFEKKKIYNFDEFYNNVDELSKNFEDRDIVIIIAESLERSYYSHPELSYLNLNLLKRKDVIDFSNIFEAEEYTSWTIAGIVAANCSLPLINNDFYENINCLSDLLYKRNYKLSSIQGSSLEFAGNGIFYRIHNVSELFGYEEILSKFPGNEKSVWGVHDDLLFKFSKEKIRDYEDNSNNFAIWINTLDSHPPNGLLSSNCKSISANIQINLLKTVYCTDYYINNFIDHSKNLDKEKNNIYIVISDHFLNPSPISNKYFDKYENRRNLFLIIDPYKKIEKKIIQKVGNPLDIAPTIINYLNGHEKLGLGVSLLNENYSSLSSQTEKVETILSQFQKNLKKFNKSIDFLKLSIHKDEKKIYVNSNPTFPVPILNFKNSTYVPETDPNGYPKENIVQIISKLFLDNKDIFNFEAISSCEAIKIYNSNKKLNCSYTYIKAIDEGDEIILNLRPFNNVYNQNFLTVSQASKKIIVDKKNFRRISLEVVNKKSKIKLKFDNIKADLLSEIKKYFPKFYSFILSNYLDYKNKTNKKNFKKNYKNKFLQNFYFNPDKFIAHGGGKIDNFYKTNTLESLNYNYEKGSRLFELDLNLTSDQKIVAVHDWLSWKNMTNHKGSIPPTYSDFMSNKIYSKYNVLDANIILDWFLNNKDAVLFTDKLDDAILIKNNFKDIGNRLIIELFSQEQIDRALNNNIGNILISQRMLWRNNYSFQYLNELSKLKVKPTGFSVNKNTVYKHPEFFLKAKKLGFKTYVYNINETQNKNNEIKVFCELSSFITGLYADDISNLKNRKKIRCF